MDQARAAIESARSAGADRYAADGFTAAVSALERSRAAVDDKDYRLALNHALDARERAQTAERTATDTKAQLRAEIERTLTEVATPIAVAHARLATAEKNRAARRLIRQHGGALSAIDADVQKAGEALKAGDYPAAQALLKDIRTRIADVSAQIDKTGTSVAARRRR